MGNILSIAMWICAGIIYFFLIVQCNSIDNNDDIKGDSEIIRFLFSKPYTPILFIYWPIIFLLAHFSSRVFPIIVCVACVGFILWIVAEEFLYQRKFKKLRSRYPESFKKRLAPQELVKDGEYLTWKDPDISEITEIEFNMRTIVPWFDNSWKWNIAYYSDVKKEDGCVTARFSFPNDREHITYEVMPILRSDDRTPMSQRTDITHEEDWPVKSYQYGRQKLYFMCWIVKDQQYVQARYEGSLMVDESTYNRVLTYRKEKQDWTDDPTLRDLYKTLQDRAISIININADDYIKERISNGTYEIYVH